MNARHALLILLMVAGLLGCAHSSNDTDYWSLRYFAACGPESLDGNAKQVIHELVLFDVSDAEPEALEARWRTLVPI